MRVLTLVMLFAVTGCISTEHTSDNSKSSAEKLVVNEDGLVCKREKPTGSHRSMKICRTVEEVQMQREKAEQMSREHRNNSQINTGE